MIFVIPNGIAAAADDPAAEAQVAPAGSGAIRVVSVGTVAPRKRYEDLIHAVAQLTRVSIECVICGTFLYLEPEALGIVQGSPDRFRLLDGLSDEAVRAWVKSADIFCLPSGSETQGIAVYEAALLAKALVLSDLPCYRGVFFHGRETLLFPVGDVDLLAAMLEALATRPSLRTPGVGGSPECHSLYGAAILLRFRSSGKPRSVTAHMELLESRPGPTL